jgi:tetratricopeptide (TPR) repeat protein
MPRPTAASIKLSADRPAGPPWGEREAGDRAPPARSRLAAPGRLRRWLCALGLLYLPLPSPAADTAEVLLPLLQGEFAFQLGDHAAAASHYLDAAELSDDPAVAERAARIALLADADPISVAAVERWQLLAPDAPALRSLQALLALRGDDPAAAQAALEILIAQPDGWKQAVQVLAAQPGGIGQAQLFAALVASPALPAEMDPLLALGGLALSREMLGVAASIAERVTRQHPGEPRAWLWLAEVERRHARPEAARAAIDAALALPALDASTRLAVAAQLDALGDPAAAAASLALAEQDDTMLAGRAAYLARAESTDLLSALYEEVQAAEGAASPVRRYLLGQLAELLDDIPAALAWYAELETGPNREQAQLRIAILQEKSAQPEAALATLHALQHSDSEQGELLVDAYLLEAELLRKRGEPARAIDALERGLAIFEDEPELLYARALAWERMDRVDAALRDLRRLVALDPDSADALNALGYTLADRTGEYQEAHRLITRALQLKPDNAAVLDSMGWVLHKLGRSHEGLVYLRRAFSLQPDAEVAAHLGEVLWLLGERDEARSIWQQGSTLEADNRALRATLERYAP